MPNLTLPNELLKEFNVAKDGKTFASRKAVARLCGVNYQAVQRWVGRLEGGKPALPKMLQPFAGQSFKGGPLPDTLVAAFIKYYAYQGREEAQAWDSALGATGLRSLIQQALHFEPVRERRLTRQEIIELCVLPAPSEWERRFSEEYYNQLSRLTGLTAQGNSRPNLWAMRTKELVYDYLPGGIYDAVKQCKAETGGYDKLHQFLSEDGLLILERHQKELLTLMRVSLSISQLKTLLDRSCTGTYQLWVLGDG